MSVLWKIWANHPLLLAGPVGYFLLQPYFYLLFYPWLFFLLVVLPTKPLSSGECTHESIFGPWNYAFSFCPEMVFPKTCTIKFLVLTNWPCHHHLHLKRHWSGAFGHPKSCLDALRILSNTLCAWPDLAWFFSLHCELDPLTQQACPLSS